MNPYAPLSSNPTDVGIAWAFVTGWLIAGTALLHSLDLASERKIATYCWAAARSFLWLCIAFVLIALVGLIFLQWLKIVSGFWFIWELLWLMSVVCIFRVLPFFCVLLVGWALVSRLTGTMKHRTIFVAVSCPAALVLNAALYFVMEFAAKTHTG
jgi:hypothetical protein